MSSTSAADGLAIVGTIFAVGLFASQIPLMRKIYHAGSAEGFSRLPTYLLLATVTSWLGYSICVLDRIDLIFLNSTGIAFQVAYLIVFARYSGISERRNIAITVGGITTSITVLHVLLFCVFIKETASWNAEFSAASAALVTISMFVSPARALYDAILAMDESHVSELMSAASLLYSVIWTAFGALIGDYFIVTPNGCGVVLSVMQLSALAFIKCSNLKRHPLAGNDAVAAESTGASLSGVEHVTSAEGSESADTGAAPSVPAATTQAFSTTRVLPVPDFGISELQLPSWTRFSDEA